MIVNVVMGPYGSASTTAVDISVIGDLHSRLTLDASGKLVWGDGTAVQDTNLYRAGADSLKTDDGFTVGGALAVTGAATVTGALVANSSVSVSGGVTSVRPAANSGTFMSYVSGGANAQFFFDASGKHNWGDGTAVQDTNLYRAGADSLKTDDAFTVGGALAALGSATVTGALVANSTVTVSGGITSVRPAPTSGTFMSYVSGGANSQFFFDASGKQNWGDGTAVQDTNLYRVAVGTLKTDGSLTVAGVVRPGNFITAARPTPASAGVGGQIYDTTLSKPIWSDGTTWRDAAGAPA